MTKDKVSDLFNRLEIAAQAVVGWSRWQVARAWRARLDRARAHGYVPPPAAADLERWLERAGYLQPRTPGRPS